MHILQAEKQCSSTEGQRLWSAVPRKSSKLQYMTTVPQTDTGDLVEKTKTNELEVLKELGKKAAVS